MSGYMGNSPYGWQPFRPPPGPPPNNYLGWAIVTTVMCCMPFGVASIVYAAQVNSKWHAGDYEGAYRSSRNARRWAFWSAASIVIPVIVWFGVAIIDKMTGVFGGNLLDDAGS